MSNEEMSTGAGSGSPRRAPARQGVGGSPVGSTLSIVLAVVAVVAGFLILRDLTKDDTSTAETGEPASSEPGPSTTFDAGVTTTIELTTTTAVALVTDGATVVVANGNTIGGSAGRMSEALGAAGYNMGAPVNADKNIDVSIVYFDPTNTAAQAVAESVARSLGNVAVQAVPTPAPTDDGSLAGAGVLVVLGNAQADKTLESLALAAGGATPPALGSAPAVAGGDVVAPTTEAPASDVSD